MLIQKQGLCKYCKQYIALEVPENFTEDEVNEEASRKCNCEGARAAMQIEEIQAVAEANLKEMFKDNPCLKPMEEQAISIVEPMSKYQIHKASLNFGQYTLTMKRKEQKIGLLLVYKDEDKRE